MLDELRRDYDSAFKKLVRAYQRGSGAHLTEDEVRSIAICLSNHFAEYDEKGNPLEPIEN